MVELQITKRFSGNIMLLIAAVIWGTAFVAQSEGMAYVEPFTYGGIRTLIGGFVLIPIILAFRKAGGKQDRPKAEKKAQLRTTVKGGICCGLVLFAASSLQQWGITMTTAGKAGFITALYIIIVPVFELILYRKSSLRVWLCVTVAAIGFWLLCIKEGFTVGTGDMLVLLCAVCFAVHIMTIDHFNEKNADPLLMSCIQFFTAGTIMTVCMFIFEEPELGAVFDAKYTILYAGIMSSGAAFTLQILGQRTADPASATLIMSLESVFAALSGWLILHEALLPKELLGCVLVFGAVIFVQLKNPFSVFRTDKLK